MLLSSLKVGKNINNGEWYFCIYRQGTDDDRPKFLMSAQPEERAFSDYLLRAGERASYYIMIQYADGRSSEPSNVIMVEGTEVNQ